MVYCNRPYAEITSMVFDRLPQFYDDIDDFARHAIGWLCDSKYESTFTRIFGDISQETLEVLFHKILKSQN